MSFNKHLQRTVILQLRAALIDGSAPLELFVQARTVTDKVPRHGRRHAPGR